MNKVEATSESAIVGNTVLVKVKFIPNTNYSRTTCYNMDYSIGVNGKAKTKFFGK